MGDLDLEFETKKDSILEKINKRNKERQTVLDAKLEQRNKENLDLEGVDYFSGIFTERIKDIEDSIFNIQQNEDVDLAKKFAGINTEIQELQRYLTNSTIFLNDYKVNACQTILNELGHRSDETRQRLIPKKKFGFNRKLAKPQIKKITPTIDVADKSNLSPTCFEWTLANRKSEHLILINDKVDGKDLTLSNLNDCLIEIQGHAGSLQVSNIENCIILSGPISRSLFAEHCKNSTIVAACQQLRLHSSINCKLWLHVTCRGIIEDCKEIEIGEYNYTYSNIEIDFKKSGLDRSLNNYKDIADFNWLSPDIPSPNWKLINNLEINDMDWALIRCKFRDPQTL